MGILTYKNNSFYMDGAPYTVISGAMHYFRIPREYWRDRILKLKECGFNTLETYTCWNLHERREGEFDFSGQLDIAAYIDCAAELGMNVILRPGPYICAEWDFGGLPSWLLTYEKMPLRCYDEVFLSKVRRYYTRLFDEVRAHLASRGGSIIMLQIENEYGSYGNDKKYMRAIAELYRELRSDCLLFTSDGPTATMLSGGSLPEYLCAANFGSNVYENFRILAEFRKNQPLMCGEFWCGWFDHWGEEHHVRPTDEIVQCVRDFAACGASFNFYMFHGGTNFGFTNGANYGEKYEPTVTSYDYNAPLNEAGDRTETYRRIKEILAPHVPVTARNSKKAAYGSVALTHAAGLFENLYNISSPVRSPDPKFMEDIGQDFGYILYRTALSGPKEGAMEIEAVHDRAHVFADGELKAVFERWSGEPHCIDIPLGEGESVRLDILCENMGRVNYGNRIRDKKGINGVRFGMQYHFGWDIFPLTMENLDALKFSPADAPVPSPAFYRGNLEITGEVCDTFIRLDGFTKGFVTVNGHNIGRYFNPAGPQKTLYVPAPFLRAGGNEIIVFESDATDRLQVTFTDTPELG